MFSHTDLPLPGAALNFFDGDAYRHFIRISCRELAQRYCQVIPSTRWIGPQEDFRDTTHSDRHRAEKGPARERAHVCRRRAEAAVERCQREAAVLDGGSVTASC